MSSRRRPTTLALANTSSCGAASQSTLYSGAEPMSSDFRTSAPTFRRAIPRNCLIRCRRPIGRSSTVFGLRDPKSCAMQALARDFSSACVGGVAPGAPPLRGLKSDGGRRGVAHAGRRRRGRGGRCRRNRRKRTPVYVRPGSERVRRRRRRGARR